MLTTLLTYTYTASQAYITIHLSELLTCSNCKSSIRHRTWRSSTSKWTKNCPCPYSVHLTMHGRWWWRVCDSRLSGLWRSTGSRR